MAWLRLFHPGGAALALTVVAVLLSFSPASAQWDPNSNAPNAGGISGSRHNLSMTYLGSNVMDFSRNEYGEVCVYCHTPHGANSTINAPLWNRTNLGNTYTLYNVPLMSGQTPTQPGVNSLTCLSCHDGTLAIDSIINMPSSQSTAYPGNYLASQETSQNLTFLDSWTPGPGSTGGTHRVLSSSTGNESCLLCHQSSFGFGPFTVLAIGTDLSDDHPVGVQLPDTATFDFNAPSATTAGMKIYDTNSNGRADSNEVRFYNTGEGYEVECASCHDPHGVPVGGSGGPLIPSFLRVNNSGSALCLTCHVK